MNYDTKAFMKSLPIVASALGDKYGVKVEIGGSEAFTDGRTVYLPELPLDAPDDLLLLARGYIDHEAAHVRYTEFALLRDTTDISPLAHWIQNLLEDVRIEHLMSERYSGCASNLRALAKKLFIDDATTVKTKKPSFEATITTWLIKTVRGWDFPEIADDILPLTHALNRDYPKLLPSIRPLLEEYRAIGKPTTGDSIVYGMKIARVIGDVYSEAKQKQQGNQMPTRKEKKEEKENSTQTSNQSKSINSSSNKNKAPVDANDNAKDGASNAGAGKADCTSKEAEPYIPDDG